MATIEALLTAEEYYRLPDTGRPSELVRGQVVMMNNPGARHGCICGNITFLLKSFLRQHDLGYVLTNDSGVITERSPDSVRGPDVAYYSYGRIPKGQLPSGYPKVPPELVFEVRSPSDRWKNILSKVAEYLQAGVLTVCVVDPEDEIVIVYHPDRTEERLDLEKSLTFPEILPGFSVPVRELF
jgi:Uma2 family endonuclease